MNPHVIDMEKSDIRKRQNQARPGYKRGNLERKVEFKEWRDAPPNEKCAYCRNPLNRPPRDIYSSVDKVVQINRKEWAHSVCYWVNCCPAHSFGFKYHERSSGQWFKRG